LKLGIALSRISRNHAKSRGCGCKIALSNPQLQHRNWKELWSPDLTTLLERLVATDVEFVLVGGLAAVAQGAPVTTFDVDIVHLRTEENVDRLIAFLADVGARYRNRPGEPLPPSRSALLGPGHALFMTDLGPLDALGTIEGGADYDQLLPDSLAVHLGGRPLRVGVALTLT
jgi:hypothetical protein